MKYNVSHKAITKTYAVLHQTADHLLYAAKEQQERSMLNLRAATVFYAFAFEAYLNHVGYEEIELWDELERISHASKLRIISKHLKLKLDRSRPPFQTIGVLFKLRDMLAHGRTTTMTEEYIADEAPIDYEPIDDSYIQVQEWERLTTDIVENYARCVGDAIVAINLARSRPDKHLWDLGSRRRTIKSVNE